MYKLIGWPQTRAMRVAWMLEELDQSYEWDPARPRSEAARAYRADGKVPALICDEGSLVDSVAICTFLADRHRADGPVALTAPAGAFARAVQDSVTQFCVDEIEGALWTSAKHSFIHPEALRAPDVKPACRHEFALAMEKLAVLLGDSEFVTGERFTVPDLLLGHCAIWAGAAKFDLPDGVVGAYFSRVLARPALARARSRADVLLSQA